MTNIDFSQMETAEEKEGKIQKAMLDTRKAECRQMIFAVVDQTAQMNLAAAAGAGALNDADLAVYRIGLGWIAAMRGASKDFDQDWPAVPDEVSELAGRF